MTITVCDFCDETERMQSGGDADRTRRGVHLVAQWLRLLVAATSLRLAMASGPRPGPPVLLAATTGFTTTRGPAAAGEPPGSGERIDPEVVEQVRSAQEGNAYAFALLYDRYVDKVYAYCFHRVGDAQTAEDLTADVFMRALKRIGTFRWQGVDFGAWLVTIARNRCHDHFKSARFRMESAVAEVYDDPAAVPAYDAQPERNLELADLRAAVHAGLGKLKSEQAEVLYHRFLQGYDVETTAAIMGKKDGAIRALQYRALKALAKHVDVEALL